MFTNSTLPNLARKKGLAKRRRGVSMVLFAFSLPVIFACLAMVIDMGNLYNIRARTQRAADAAALAGAITSDGTNAAAVTKAAQDYSGLNEFPVSDPTVNLIVQQGQGSGGTNTVRVVVQKRAAVYFSPIMESLIKRMGYPQQAVYFSRNVSSEAIAEKIGSFKMSVPGFYGIADASKAPANLGVFGPYANHQWGDPYSVLYNENGTPNAEYNPKGYEYTITVNSNFKSSDNKLYVQVFDPDSYSPNGNSWDEEQSPNSANQTQSPTGNNNTRTQYDLLTMDDKVIATANYADDQSTNEKWTTPLGFDVDMNAYAGQQLKLRVHSTDGATENGYLLRAGPKEGLTLSDTEWNKQFGDNNNTDPSNIMASIVSEGSLQMNFTQSGTVKFALGYVSSDYAGKEITISKFDVDVGSQSITYTNSGLPNQTFAGTFPDTRNDTWNSDKITLPNNYPGGIFYAEYVAGKGDTSNWKITGAKSVDGSVYLSK